MSHFIQGLCLYKDIVGHIYLKDARDFNNAGDIRVLYK